METNATTKPPHAVMALFEEHPVFMAPFNVRYWAMQEVKEVKGVCFLFATPFFLNVHNNVHYPPVHRQPCNSDQPIPHSNLPCKSTKAARFHDWIYCWLRRLVPASTQPSTSALPDYRLQVISFIAITDISLHPQLSWIMLIGGCCCVRDKMHRAMFIFEIPF